MSTATTTQLAAGRCSIDAWSSNEPRPEGSGHTDQRHVMTSAPCRSRLTTINRFTCDKALVRRNKAFTLIEATLSVVLASVLIVSAMWTFGAAGKAKQAAMYRYTASGLANQLMSEILQCRYSDPSGTNVFGPEAAEITGNRSLFDDVDDYNGWTETPPKNKDGTTISGFTGWRRDVAVAYVSNATAGTTIATSGTDVGLKRVTVTVTDPRGAQTVLVAVRSSNGSYDQKVTQATTCVGWVGVRLQIGSDSSSTIVAGQSIPNIVP